MGMIAGAAGFLIWVLINAIYAIPAADDFCYGYGAQLRGVVQNVVHEYFNWGGRFSATIIMGAFAVSSELLLKHTYLVPLTVLLLNLLAARHLFQTMEISNKAVFLFFFAMLIATFRMRDSMFWLAGAATYGVACAIFLVLVAEEYRIFVRAFAPSRARVAVLSVAAFILSGFNETVMLAHISLLLPLCAFCFVRKQGRVVAWILAAAIIGGAISALAPGNFIRPSHLTSHPSLFLAAWTALKIVGAKYLISFVLSLLLFRLVLALFPAPQQTGFSSRQVTAFSVFMFFALWGSIFARTYALNEIGPERTRTIDYMLINGAAFIIACQWSAQRAAAAKGVSRILVGSVSGVLILVLVSFVAVPQHTWQSWVSSTSAGMDLRRLMDDRFALVRQGGSDSFEVAAYTYEPRPINFFGDIKPDPKEWENMCFSQYFGIKEIRTKSAP